MPLRITLRDHTQQLPRPRSRNLKRKAEDALHAHPSEDADFSSDRVGRVSSRGCGTAMAGVFTFGVLAHDDPVEFAWIRGAGGEGGGGTAEDAGGAHVGVLVEGGADGQDHLPKA